MMRIIHALLAAILLLCSPDEHNAANHYCFPGGTTVLSMKADTEQSEKLLTNYNKKLEYRAGQYCKWQMRLREMTQPRQMVLQLESTNFEELRMLANTALGGERDCNFTLSLRLTGTGADFSEEWQNRLSVFPMILPIQSSAQTLNVHFKIGSAQPNPNCSRVEILIKVAKKGYCGRNMLLHRGRCHLVSDNELSLEDTMGKDGARLTAFPGIEQIEEFIGANKKRRQLYPFISPLNFSSPVRVGVFFCRASSQSFYWKSDGNGSFVSDSFQHSSQSIKVSNLSGQCAFIQTSANETLQLGFSNCSQPMRALLSFPEIPSNQSTDGIPHFLNVSNVCAPPPSIVKIFVAIFIFVARVINWAVIFTLIIVAAARFFIIRINKCNSESKWTEMESFPSRTSGSTQNEIGQNQQRENEHESTEVRQEGVKIQIDIFANTTSGSLDCASVRNLRSQDEHNQTQENRQWNTDNGQERVDSQMGSSENAARNSDTGYRSVSPSFANRWNPNRQTRRYKNGRLDTDHGRETGNRQSRFSTPLSNNSECGLLPASVV